MKVVVPRVSPEVLASRKRLGRDLWDEIWGGVLHMPPMPNSYHQDLEGAMEAYLRLRWARPMKAKVYHQINLAAPGGWPDKEYRIPDLVLLTPERFHIDRIEYFEGAPDVVVEIQSPGDESMAKMPFYADLGVPEVWIVHRDSKEPTIYLLKRGRYKLQLASKAGWMKSPATSIEMRATADGKLAMRLAGDESTREDLPEE